MTIDIDKLEQLARAATPGPWKRGTWQYEMQPSFRYVEIRPSDDGDVSISRDLPTYDVSVQPIVGGCGCCGSPCGLAEDGAYIAAVDPTTVCQLIADLRLATAVVDEVRRLRAAGDADLETTRELFAALAAYDAGQVTP